MAEVVRYRPDRAVQWLQLGAKGMRDKAARAGSSIIRREGSRSIARDLSQTAGALFDMGKSAVADVAHLAANATEYSLHDDHFEVVKPTGVRTISYAEITTITWHKSDAHFDMERGGLKIGPPAFIVSGTIRAPIGWLRNGVEVPFELLITEIAARAGLEISEDKQ
ncbi:MAG: hypothetical protein JST40_11185 [Armatimonadetes bacterium]|nr:hypothetical protein [Armatimonadota bacterium]